MKIGLIDVDRHNFPNLALMKISAYEKANGNDVEWWNGLKHYDKVYKAKVFDETYSEDIDYAIMADEVIKGGTGYDLQNNLPEEVEHQYPDYGLYSNFKDTAYGFLTRGCKFCIVSEKEGRKSRQVAELNEFWRGQKYIKLLDPNITACDNCELLFDELIRAGSWVDFTQGIDARLITEKQCDQLNLMNIKMLHFAWDNYEMQTYEKLKSVRNWLKYGDRKLRVYVLTNFNTTHEQDLERVYKLKEIGYDPYIMIYNKPHAPKITRQLQRYVNNKFIFRSCDNFEEYKGENMKNWDKFGAADLLKLEVEE